MNRREQQRFYQSRPWRAMSRAARERDGWLCQRCLPRRVAAAVAHHVVPIEQGGDPLEIGGLVSLCRPCHELHHGRTDKLKAAWSAYIKELVDTI